MDEYDFSGSTIQSIAEKDNTNNLSVFEKCSLFITVLSNPRFLNDLSDEEIYKMRHYVLYHVKYLADNCMDTSCIHKEVIKKEADFIRNL